MGGLINKEILLFCQAPADLPSILTIYKENKERSPIAIFVVNVEGVYNFIKDLKLELKSLIFIPYELRSFKSIRNIILERKRIIQINNKYFVDVRFNEIYFFSKYEDWLTASFISTLSKNKDNRIFYVDHYDELGRFYKPSFSLSIKILLYKLLLKYLTNISFKTNLKEILPEFPLSNYNIHHLNLNVNPVVYKEYQFNLSRLDLDKNKIIFFLSPCETSYLISGNYIQTIIEIINVFQQMDCLVCVKGHPRMGLPEGLENHIDFEIPSYVPGEFIDHDLFSMFFGIDTKVIAHYAGENLSNCYSLIKMFQYSNKQKYDAIINYLTLQSNSKIKFIRSLEELENIALTIQGSKSVE
jgi:hypothetical protein